MNIMWPSSPGSALAARRSAVGALTICGFFFSNMFLAIRHARFA
jgi:hypothetical protein